MHCLLDWGCLPAVSFYFTEDGKIDKKELSEFYMKFIGIPEDNVKSLATYAMDQMTDVSTLTLNNDGT